MKLNKVGDCLSYGLTHELFDITENQEYRYLKAVLVFLILNEKIDRTESNKIQIIFRLKEKSEIALKNVLGLVAGNLKRTIQFDCFEEMIENLNQFKVPIWIYEKSIELFDMLPNVYIVNNSLYYIESQKGRCSLRYLDIKRIEEVKDFDVYICNGGDELSRTISNRYSRIMGYNKTLGILYLSVDKIDEMYVEYHVDTNQEVIIHKRCFGILANEMPVVDEKGYLAIVLEKESKQIKKIDPMELYKVDVNEIYVTPQLEKPIMFKPYRISAGGEIIAVSYCEARDYLWNLMKRINLPFFEKLGEAMSDLYSADKLRKDDIFSLKLLVDNDNLSAKTNHSVVKILSKFFSMEEDLLDYFYVMVEATRRLDQHTMRNNLSMQLFMRLNELYINGELEKCIYDLEAFKNKLLEVAYWNDEKIEELRNDYKSDSKVGCFEIKGEKIEVSSIPLREGLCIGGVIIMPESIKEGIVTYNIDLEIFEIQYSRLLCEEEIREILIRFNLEDREYHVIIESRGRLCG